MQAARAKRRKERILKSTDDRMKLVSGGEIGDLPISIEKRLVLDDDEMDPALASRSDKKAVEVIAIPKEDIVKEEKVAMEPTVPKDILDDALDEVFEEEVKKYL